MSEITVRTQAELDRALAAHEPGDVIVCIGTGQFRVSGSAHVAARGAAHVVAWGAAHVVAWGSVRVVAWGSAYVVAHDSAHVVAHDSAHVVARGSAHVVAWDSAHVVAWDSAHVEARGSAHVEAWDSAHVDARGSAHVVAHDSAHVVAWDSAHVDARGSAHVEAWDSAHVDAWGSVRVVARGSAHVVAHDSAHVVASRWVTVLPGGVGYDGPTIIGGTILERPVIDTAALWCEYHGVRIGAGIAVLYKAVDDEYRSEHGTVYAPGTTPEAPDWDGGVAECGGGLHFSASPAMAASFMPNATRYVACPVRVDELVVHADAALPGKVKARRVAAPCWEVDLRGTEVTR